MESLAQRVSTLKDSMARRTPGPPRNAVAAEDRLAAALTAPRIRRADGKTVGISGLIVKGPPAMSSARLKPRRPAHEERPAVSDPGRLGPLARHGLMPFELPVSSGKAPDRPLGGLQGNLSVRARWAASQAWDRSTSDVGPAQERMEAAPKLSPLGPRTPIGYESVEASSSSGVFTQDDETRLLPDKESCPEAFALAQKIFNDRQVGVCVERPADRCFEAATRVTELLHLLDVPHTVRGMLVWKGATDDCPENHFSVLVTLGGTPYMIDPTAAQFNGCKPMFVEEAVWQGKLASSLRGRAVGYKDYPSTAQAQIGTGSLYGGGPMTFEGGQLLVKPDWYKKLRSNPEARRQLMARLEEETQPSGSGGARPAKFVLEKEPVPVGRKPGHGDD
jgi:hypothetical protein